MLGLDALLDAPPADMPLEHLAYCLATAFHETGAKMQPVVENLKYSSAARIRTVWPSRFPTDASAQPFVNNPQLLANKVYGGRMGNDGWTYRGRGFVQITGRDNYERAGKKLLASLVNKPELATDSRIAASILYAGMQEGWFTGKKLSDYFRRGLTDPYNARKIINGLDRAGDVAGYYHKFVAALTAAQQASESVVTKGAGEAPQTQVPQGFEGGESTAPIPLPPDIEPTPAPVPQPAQPAGFFYAALKNLLEAISGRKA